jgi:hypothetical protein
MRSTHLFRPLLALGLFVFASVATSGAAGQPIARQVPGPVGAAAPVPSNQITELSISPAAPKPDQPFTVRVNGAGTCRLWLRVGSMASAPGVPGGTPPPSGWGDMGTGAAAELGRPPDTTLALPGNLTALKLAAGRYKISVDTHDPFKGANCKGSLTVEVQVGDAPPPPPPTPANRPGAAPPLGTTPPVGTAPKPTGPGGTMPVGPGAGNTNSTANNAATQRITGLSLIPASPTPDQPVRVRVDGAGTCKVWFGYAQIDGPRIPGSPLVPSWNPLPVINEITRPADATVTLPNDIAPLKLGAGRYKIAVSSHEGLAGSTCKGFAEIEVTVPARAPLQIAPRAGGAAPRVAPR